MTRTRTLLASILLWCFAAAPALAQSTPGWTYGYVPTTAQWNSLWASKQDYLGAPPLLTTGGTMVGPLGTAASIAGAAGLNVPPGTAPSSPNDGDVWETTTGFFTRINGTTYNLISPASTCPFCALTNAANTFTAGPQTITPPANTLTQGMVVVQSGPNSGSTAGPQAFNLLSVTDNDNTLTGSGTDAFGLLNVNSAAFRVNYTVSSTGGSPRNGAIVAVNYTGSSASAQPVGLISSVYSNSTSASMWGAISYAALDTAGVTGKLFSNIAEISAWGSATVGYRAGYITLSEGSVAGGTYDAAFMVGAQAVAGHGTPAGFKNLIGISNNVGGATALDTGANLISADSATTIANGLKLDLVTITGNIIITPKLTISGSTGAANFGSNAAPPTAGANFTGTSMGKLSIVPDTNNTAGFDYFQAQTSAADNQVSMLAAEATNTGTFFGQTIGNWAMLRAAGANNAGLVIGTAGNLPLILGTNNAARITIAGAGGVTIAGVPVLPGLSVGTCSTGIGLDASNNVVKISCPSAASSIQVGTTAIASGTTQNLLYNNGGALANAPIASFLTAGTGMAAISGTNPTIGLATITGPGVLGASGNGAGQAVTTVQAPILLNTLTASNSATLSDTTSLTATYSMYELVFENVVPATASSTLELQVHSGGVYQNSSYVSTVSTSTGGGAFSFGTPTTFIQVAPGNANNVAPGISGRCRIHTPTGTAAGKMVCCETLTQTSTPAAAFLIGGGYWNNTAAIDGFQLLFSSGNITSGTIKVYGYP